MKIYIVQCFDNFSNAWSDLYTSNDLDFVISFKEIYSKKNKFMVYRVIEVLQ